MEKILTPNTRPIAIDLFSGAGGMSLGFEQAGFDIVLAIDKDGYHVATHKRNFPYGVSLCCSITDISGKEIRKIIGLNKEIDLVFGGPPCQGFSHMGYRNLADPRNTLVDEFVRLVGEIRPKAFVMENVPGMQTGTTSEIFERAIKKFKKINYTITEPVQRLNAKNYGVPQDRVRLFVLGLRGEFKRFIPYPWGRSENGLECPTIAQALEGLPVVEKYEFLFREDKAPYEQGNVTSRYARIARGLDRDASDLSYPRIYDASQVSGCLRVRHNEQVQSLYAATPQGEMVPGHKLPKLDPQGIAPTLRAGSESERGSHTAPRPIHPILPRCITAREAARLHGFPDWFSFYPAKWHAYRQIGNAVCPPVAKAIGQEIIKILDVNITPPTRPIELTDNFILPENRPKSHKRIPHLDEFPKVVEFLFCKAFDPQKKILKRSTFSLNDIKKAIISTSAKISKGSLNRFLKDIARSRNVEKIIATPLKYGYTIIPLENGGKFVPNGTLGSLNDKDAIKIRSEDLISAPTLQGNYRPFQSTAELISLLEERDILEKLWNKRVMNFNIERNLFGCIPDDKVVRFSADLNYKRLNGLVVVSESGKIPTKSRIMKLLQNHICKIAILAVRLTREHIFLSRFQIAKNDLIESARSVFRVVGNENQERTFAVLSSSISSENAEVRT